MSIGERTGTFLASCSQTLTATIHSSCLGVLRMVQKVCGTAPVTAQDGVVLAPIVHHGLLLAHVFLEQTCRVQRQVQFLLRPLVLVLISLSLAQSVDVVEMSGVLADKLTHGLIGQLHIQTDQLSLHLLLAFLIALPVCRVPGLRRLVVGTARGLQEAGKTVSLGDQVVLLLAVGLAAISSLGSIFNMVRGVASHFLTMVVIVRWVNRLSLIVWHLTTCSEWLHISRCLSCLDLLVEGKLPIHQESVVDDSRVNVLDGGCVRQVH